MPQQWCERCWTLHKLRTPAEWDIDGDLYCSRCKQDVGYESTKGIRLGRADAIASAAPSATEIFEANERFDDAIKKAFMPEPANAPRRTNGGSNMELQRTCSAPGCTRKLISTNKSGRCGDHWYVPKKQKALATTADTPIKPRLPRLLTTATKQASAESNSHADGMATICVPASALDSWWAKLSLEDKAENFSNWIARAQ